MELLNIEFAILIVKLAICVLPLAIGISLVSRGEETKREIRDWVCSRLFGVSNAIDYKKFFRAIHLAGFALMATGALAFWFLFVSAWIGDPSQ